MSCVVPETWHHLLFKPRQIREGLGSSQLVQHGQVAIEVVSFPHVPLSGVLFEQGPCSPAGSRTAVWSYSVGDLLIGGSPTYKLQETNRLSK